MKKIGSIPREVVALAGLILFFSLLSGASWAIPNQVGGFFNLAGMRFEDFAAGENAWKTDTALPARWENWSDDAIDSTAMVWKLSVPATVFGLPAEEVIVVRERDRALRYRVFFSPGERTLDQLAALLRANVDAWADRSEGGDRFRSGHTRITIQVPDDHEGVTATFEPLATATAARS